MSNSETILSAQTHIGDSSVQAVIGDPYQGDGYYGRSDGFHTIQYTLTGFIGTVNIQATLAVEPADDDWFTVYTQNYPVNNDTGTTGSFLINFTGNYVWVRATLSDWSDGTVNSVKLNH
jgi:hypothetical protein